MANIGGMREPGDPGSTVDGIIDTPMCKENVGKKAAGGIHTYGANTGVPSSDKGGVSIDGPGVKGTWKKK